jgi:hypothetical protein
MATSCHTPTLQTIKLLFFAFKTSQDHPENSPWVMGLELVEVRRGHLEKRSGQPIMGYPSKFRPIFE